MTDLDVERELLSRYVDKARRCAPEAVKDNAIWLTGCLSHLSWQLPGVINIENIESILNEQKVA